MLILNTEGIIGLNHDKPMNKESPNQKMHTWQQQLNQARAWLQQGKNQQALDVLQSLHGEHPQQPEVTCWLGNTLRNTGQLEAAEKNAQARCLPVTGIPRFHIGLAFLYQQLGRMKEAIDLLATSAGPGLEREAVLQIVGLLRSFGATAAARTALHAWCGEHADDARALFLLGRLHQSLGEFDEARDCYLRSLDLNPGHSSGWLRLAKIRRFTDPEDPEISLMQQTLERNDSGKDTEICLHFALGKINDDLAEFGAAAAHFEQGNSIQNRVMHWSGNRWQAWTEQVCSGCDEAWLNVLRERSMGLEFPGPNPLLITGMLRSGTTLLETMLDRHAQIKGCGELNVLGHLEKSIPGGMLAAATALSSATVRDFTSAYALQLKPRDSTTRWSIDKNPMNFRYIGLAAGLIEGARIIHCRRDPRDIAISTWSQLFQHDDTAYSYATGNITAYYRGYLRLMQHWESLLPQKIFSFDYEDLVRDSQAVLRKLLVWLELPWDEVVLSDHAADRTIHTASAWQARQPVYTSSVGRWKNYQPYLGEWFEELVAARDEG